jgi:hypothetical protein
VQIECRAPRAVFAGLVASALEHAGAVPTPMATAYLIDLLAERVRMSEPGGPEGPGRPLLDAGQLLAELLALAPVETRTRRLAELRRVGDGALFLAGFFGESLARGPFGAGPTGEAGRRAYAALSCVLARLEPERIWSRLYEELADRFRDFADLLAEVAERSRAAAPPPLARLYASFLSTGSPRDRRRLLGLAALSPETAGLRRAQ